MPYKNNITGTLMSEDTVIAVMNETVFEVDREYICDFLLNGQAILRDLINLNEIAVKEDISYGLTL